MASKSDKEKKVTSKAPADSDKGSAKKESSKPKKKEDDDDDDHDDDEQQGRATTPPAPSPRPLVSRMGVGELHHQVRCGAASWGMRRFNRFMNRGS